MILRGGALGLGIAALVVACSSKEVSCPATGGCHDGFDVELTTALSQSGTYAYDLTVDGDKVSCTLAIPFEYETRCVDAGPEVGGAHCDPVLRMPCVFTTLVPFGLDFEYRPDRVLGFQIFSTAARTVSLRITRDGVLLGEKTFTPSYATRRVNECSPMTCTHASETFP